MENLGLHPQLKGNYCLKYPRWTAFDPRVNLPRHLILAVAVSSRFSAVLEDHFKQCH